MAYIFIADGEDEEDYIGETWSADSGENAIIIQPHGINEHVETEDLLKGPTHSETAYYPVAEELVDFYDAEESEAMITLGGEPLFIQEKEFPDDQDDWIFLAQLNEMPFFVNFGDAGSGYAFISQDGQTGAFLWQCH